MGKRTLVQRRGRGSPTFTAPTHKRVAPSRYPPLSVLPRDGSIRGYVMDLVHDPGRGAPLALITLENGVSYYTVACEGLGVGDVVEIGPGASFKIGNVLPLAQIPDGAIVCNSGHFNVEIEISRLDEKGNLVGGLEKLAIKKKRIRDCIDEYTLPDGKRINLLGEGRLVNLTSAEGHPSSVMDMSFANQALSAEYLVKHGKGLKPLVYPVPKDIDKEIARLKLKSMGITIDVLTEEQERYLSSWEIGT